MCITNLVWLYWHISKIFEFKETGKTTGVPHSRKIYIFICYVHMLTITYSIYWTFAKKKLQSNKKSNFPYIIHSKHVCDDTQSYIFTANVSHLYLNVVAVSRLNSFCGVGVKKEIHISIKLLIKLHGIRVEYLWCDMWTQLNFIR